MLLALAVSLSSGAVADAQSPSTTNATSAVAQAAKPKITAQPLNTRVTTGAAAKFSVKASGTGLKYQWQVKQPGSTKWSNVAGKRAPSLQVPTRTKTSGQQYRVIVGNAGGKVISRAAILTVNSTRKDPIAVGVTGKLYKWRAKVGKTDVNANAEVEADFSYNDPPRPGFRYIATRVTVTYVGSGSEDPSWPIDTVFVGGNGRTYDDPYVIYGTHVYDIGEMYKNARATFDVVAEVPVSAIAGGVWLITDRTDYSNQIKAYFKRA